MTQTSRKFWFGALTKAALLDALRDRVARDRTTTAELLAILGEVDARRLYAPAGYSSMFAYCVREHGMSEDVANKRIRAARAARRFPDILEKLADGRLHLSGVALLAKYLRRDNAVELLDHAEGKTRDEIELLIAARFPRADLATRLVPLVSVPIATPSAAPASAPTDPAPCDNTTQELAPGPVFFTASEHRDLVVPPVMQQPRVTPLAPERFALQVTIPAASEAKLRRAQELLGHAVPSGDLAAVLDRALDVLIEQLEKRRFAKVAQPRETPRAASDSRAIPAAVRRAVLARDGGCCTFVGEHGHRCGERMRLEFDHVQPVARGGRSTVENLRLRCHVHNQHEADRVFGAGFMDEKRGRGAPLVRS